MSQNYAPNRRRKKVRIKYKNVGIALAIVLLIVIIICVACNANSDDADTPGTDGDPSVTTPAVTTDPNATEPQTPEIETTSDPTKQSSYVFDFVDMTAADLGEGNLVLVNNNIEFLGSVSEDDLVVVREKKNQAYWVSDYSVMIKPVAMDALNSMLLDFYNATQNDSVMVRSGYRTIEYQQGLYDEELESTGAVSSSLVAKPGYSEHHTGLVVDFTTYDGES